MRVTTEPHNRRLLPLPPRLTLFIKTKRELSILAIKIMSKLCKPSACYAEVKANKIVTRCYKRIYRRQGS